MGGGEAHVTLGNLDVHHVGGSAGGGGEETESDTKEIVVSVSLQILGRDTTGTATVALARGGKYKGGLHHENVSQDCIRSIS